MHGCTTVKERTSWQLWNLNVWTAVLKSSLLPLKHCWQDAGTLSNLRIAVACSQDMIYLSPCHLMRYPQAMRTSRHDQTEWLVLQKLAMRLSNEGVSDMRSAKAGSSVSIMVMQA